MTFIGVPRRPGGLVLAVDAIGGLADDLQLIAYLTIGGVIRKVTPINLIFDNRDSKAQGPLTMVTAVPGLAAGEYEATLSIRNLEPDGALTVKAGLYIEFVEIKRAAL